ncbi:hypothetical protein EZV61_15515 [Corallincola luteus]|uniref:Outer membrane protein beta-barrel domain-containing protein n=2 Tax=Corallincola TaxID=1775176 RepID=A0A368NGH0_9GAMM|nr:MULTISPECIES: hypothetical protein [Corallincola]RCU49568.1 hypothetical protein DU002_11670 [Corallincola holothuriorum]TCI01985.1 hypothetical protein EZV61_15515 [Corallincola luteus]
MKTFAGLPFILILAFAPFLANAESIAESETKQWSVGVGSYALIIDSDDYGDDTFEGYALSADYAINDNFAVRGNYYSLEHEDLSSLEIDGFELLGYFGTGLMTEGFKAYIGGGFFSENLDGPFGLDEDFSGLQLNGGLGYNWEYVALDFSLAVRDPSDYEDLGDDDDDLTVVSGLLKIAFRF